MSQQENQVRAPGVQVTVRPQATAECRSTAKVAADDAVARLLAAAKESELVPIEDSGLLVFKGPLEPAAARRIATYEDPVEHWIPEVRQVSIRDVPSGFSDDVVASFMRGTPSVLIIGEPASA